MLKSIYMPKPTHLRRHNAKKQLYLVDACLIGISKISRFVMV